MERQYIIVSFGYIANLQYINLVGNVLTIER